MNYTVGKYSFSVGKAFKTLAEAVEYIQEKAPELSEKVIEKMLKPKIVENANNNSGTVSEKPEEPGKGISKNNKGRS
ncbi:hypothetical protein [Chryseobacterium sp.]|uniref:hypothetical protein n=1 Tax=Chryseobacterium sp. TaxID=1871047 RepID=UPI00289F628E|nr:hypothetical protein [Chryseobacterium sp.]